MIAENAQRLCGAQFCFVYRFDGELLHFVAHRSVAPEVLELNRRRYPGPPDRGTVAARAILERKIVQVPDVGADPEYDLGDMAAIAGYRSAAAVPILRDGVPIGCIAVTRAQKGLLDDRQIELLQDLRRPGRHRHRERAAAQRIAPAHRRSDRVAGAADGDVRGPQGHLQLAGRVGTGVPDHAGKCDPHLRGRTSVQCYSWMATCSGAWRCIMRQPRLPNFMQRHRWSIHGK